MKKILSIALVVLMALTAFTACGNTDDSENANVNFGMGVYTYFGDAASADGETNGSGEVVATVAAVLVDADGKIVKCDIDTADITVGYTSAGAAVVDGEFKTKYELGDNYNMAAYGTDLNGDGVVKEWFEQIDVLEGIIAGKTIDEVKALVADGYYGTEDVATAGCTIGISDYVKAVEKAVANAVANATESNATANDTLKVGVVTTATPTDATADANGSVEIEITVAAAVTSEGKVTVCATDVVAADITFDAKGAATTDTAAEIVTKLEKGDNYGMAAYGSDLNGDGKVLEWYEQAAAFNAACVGKTATEIAGLVVNNYQAVEEVQTAGCTMGVADIAAAIVKAAQ